MYINEAYMNQIRKNIFIGGALIIMLSVGFTTIKNKDLELVKNLDIYFTLFRELNMFYVDETDPEKLVTTSINLVMKVSTYLLVSARL